MRSTKNVKSAPTSRSGFAYVCGLVIALAGFAAYFNSFDGVFLFDEDGRIVNNERIHRLWPPWDLFKVHRPVVEVSLAVNYALGGADAAGYHAFNLLVHIAAALALFGVVRRTLLCRPIAERFGGAALPIALAVALLWMVHPVQTQSVTYVIQRGESLMGMFYLMTVYCLVRGVGSARRNAWFAVSVACCALGMGCKAVMVTAPVAVLLYDRTFLSGSFLEALRRRWGLYLLLAGCWVIPFATGIAPGVLDATPRPDAHVGFGFTGITAFEYLCTQAGVLPHYLRLSIWPVGLCLDYYWQVARSASTVIGPLMLTGPLLIATIWAICCRPHLGFVGAWFFLILLPTSSFIPIKDPAMEHRMYLPLASAVVVAVVAVHGGLSRAVSTGVLSKRNAKALGAGLLTVIAGALAWGTLKRNTAYHSELAMWSDVAAKRPDNPRAFDNLAIAWEETGRLDKAEQLLRKAITIDREYASAHANLGSILAMQGRQNEAIAEYREALRIDPAGVFARVKLGEALVMSGRIAEGLAELRSAVRQAPDYPVARYALGNALSSQGELDGAAAEYEHAIRLRPGYAEAHYSLGNALRDKGDPEGAMQRYREASILNPDLASPYNNLGYILLQLGRADEAARQFRKALRVSPDHAGARRGLAEALAAKGALSR